jgi:phosphatidylglycerol---prolipoprotein diacylglyceryl transferase
MRPILFQIGGLPIYTYGVLVATGVLIGVYFARSQASRAGLDPEKIWNLGIYTILVSLLLAKIWLVFSEWDYYSTHTREIFSIQTFQSGGTFYGGIVGALLTIVLYTYVQKMPLLSVMDIGVTGLALGHSIGRLGCFAAGCCYGKPTSVPWGITFTNPVAAQIAGTPLGVHLHPTQLYEAFAEFLNFLLLILLGRRQSFRGQMIGTYFLLYGFERGTIEFFRGDPGRTMLFHDSISLMQIVSVGLILIGAFLWWRGLRGSAPIPPLASARATAGRS